MKNDTVSPILHDCPVCKKPGWKCTCDTVRIPVVTTTERVYYETEIGGDVNDIDRSQVEVDDVQSEVDFDKLISSASKPTLADLFKKGIKAGVLEASQQYK